MRGEAFFTVAHEAAQPFEVVTEEGPICDLETRFNVYKRPERVTVVVDKGRAAVGRKGTRAERETGEQTAMSHFNTPAWAAGRQARPR